MKRIETPIEGCLILEPNRYPDERGWFQEVFNEKVYSELGLPRSAQVNISVSKKNVVRGMHRSPYPKLCTCVSGKLFDVAVDLRPESPTFLKVASVWLTPHQATQFFVPAGCAHGFFSDEYDTTLLYVQGGTYDKGADREYHWLSFGIRWPEAAWYTLSQKDELAEAYVATPPELREVSR